MSDVLKALTRAYGDGTINQIELERLENLLQNDAQARQYFLIEMNLIDALEEISLVAQAGPESENQLVSPTTRSHRWRFASMPWVSLTVLASSLLIIVNVFWQGTGTSKIGTITELHGSVRWTGQEGIVVTQLQPGDSLTGGTLEVLAADGWASFRFHDGSIVTISGQAEVVLSDRDQKRLLLRRGSFSANVEPQPTNSPMVVQTPAADIQVVGTQFNVMARATETELKVNEGRVNFLRLSDGKVLEVPSGYFAVASLDTDENFVAKALGARATSWNSRFHSNTDVMHGYWKPSLSELQNKLKQAVLKGELSEAEALTKFKESMNINSVGSVWAKPSKMGCLVWLDVTEEDGKRVLLTETTRIRVNGRVYNSARLEMGVSTYAANDGFSGKYSYEIPIRKLNLSEEGKFEWVVDVDDLLSETGKSAVGFLVHDWWCVTDSNTAKLEIDHVEILEQ